MELKLLDNFKTKKGFLFVIEQNKQKCTLEYHFLENDDSSYYNLAFVNRIEPYDLKYLIQKRFTPLYKKFEDKSNDEFYKECYSNLLMESGYTIDDLKLNINFETYIRALFGCNWNRCFYFPLEREPGIIRSSNIFFNNLETNKYSSAYINSKEGIIGLASNELISHPTRLRNYLDIQIFFEKLDYAFLLTSNLEKYLKGDFSKIIK